MSDGSPDAGQALVLERRRLIAAATAGMAVGVAGASRPASDQTVNPAGAGAPRYHSITDSAVPIGGLLQSADFGLVGVFDIDWLLEQRYTRLLDNFAASPGAFTSVRFFGALNSGEREDTIQAAAAASGFDERKTRLRRHAERAGRPCLARHRAICHAVLLSPRCLGLPRYAAAGSFRLGGARADFSARLRIEIRRCRSRALAVGGVERAEFSALLAQRFRSVSEAVPGDQ
jgi:hypothetical protein